MFEEVKRFSPRFEMFALSTLNPFQNLRNQFLKEDNLRTVLLLLAFLYSDFCFRKSTNKYLGSLHILWQLIGGLQTYLFSKHPQTDILRPRIFQKILPVQGNQEIMTHLTINFRKGTFFKTYRSEIASI